MKQMWLLLGIIFFSVLFLLLNTIFSSQDLQNQYFRIHPGESAASISQRLAAEDLISSQQIFYWFTRLSGSDQALSYGLYRFDGEFNMYQLLSKIKDGHVQLRKITIPEGLTLEKTIDILEKEQFGEKTEFLSWCYDADFAKELTGFDLPNLEGFLYPETYHFPETAAEKYIIQTMVNQHFAQTKYLDFANSADLDYYQVMILASIVEREAQIAEEKPLIASVYLNRLEIGMKLQADPTVAYALEKIGKNRKKIYYKDLKIDSSFNTYLHSGLPPAPICSPERGAIEAVLNPAETDYYFFFASGGGAHTFSQTYSQHLSRQRINQ
ncbi:MAG: endolytic transglycosylase MltG [Candidatus Cloacimonadales bacterium]